MIKSDKSLTVTDFEMTRFMMSLKESVDLVLHAFTKASGGETFIQKAEAANMRTLIKALEKLTDKKARIKITGPRHGEKYHETLATSEELSKCIESKNYYEISPDFRDLRYGKPLKKRNNHKPLEDFSSDVTRQLSADELARKIKAAGILKEID